MRKVIAFIGLGAMVVGLLFAAFGTQQVPAIISCSPTPTGSCVYYIGASPLSLDCSPNGLCYYANKLATTTHLDFTLNIIGGGLAILGAITFGVAYPTKRHELPKTFPIQAFSQLGHI